MQPRLGWSALAIFVLICSGEVAAQDCTQGFSQGAEAHVKVDYVTKQRRGGQKRFVTEAEVSWEPLAMLAHPSCYDLKATTLAYKASDEDTWEQVEADQRTAGKSYK